MQPYQCNQPNQSPHSQNAQPYEIKQIKPAHQSSLQKTRDHHTRPQDFWGFGLLFDCTVVHFCCRGIGFIRFSCMIMHFGAQHVNPNEISWNRHRAPLLYTLETNLYVLMPTAHSAVNIQVAWDANGQTPEQANFVISGIGNAHSSYRQICKSRWRFNDLCSVRLSGVVIH